MDTLLPPLGPALLPGLFLARAAAHPDAPAVLAPSGALSYGELEGSARRIAGALGGLGAGRESVVAVLVPPGPDLVAALLGIWLAGACYLPLDPFAPPARQRETVLAAGARAVVVDEVPGHDLGAPAHPVAELLAGGDPRTPALPTGERQAAYVIFTSGSTGTPKGVVVEHAGIAHRVLWGVEALGLTPRDRVLQKTPLTFDAAGWELFGPLVCGAPVVYGRPGAGRDPAELAASLREQRATVVQVVPTMLRLLAAEPELSACTELRTVCSAGEPLGAELCRRVLDRVDVEIWNTYGPTECSIDALAHRYDPAQTAGPVPIGRPLGRSRVVAVPVGSEVGDEGDAAYGSGAAEAARDAGHASAAGDAGATRPTGTLSGDAGFPGPAGADRLYELYLGGPGVARGYHGDPVRTAERFVPDPEGPPGARMFRTGDLVRRRPDGGYEFAGRADQQVKVNGVRVEPGEVEAALEAHPAVVAAAVRAVEGPGGIRRLAAWAVVSAPGTAAALPAYLRDRLPPALVPAVVTEVAALPRTSSGKTDHRRLPAPDWSGAPRAGAGAGENASEDAGGPTAEQRMVLDAWRTLLGLPAADPPLTLDDDFFRLGGHSLQLTRLAALLGQASGRDVPLAELHRTATVREQAELLARAGKAAPVAALAEGARLPLSHAQERFWVLDRMNPRSREYLLPILVWLPAEVPAAVVEDAVERTVARHEVLRTRYAMDGEGLFAVVEPPGHVPVVLRRVDTSPEQVADAVAEQLGSGFDLAAAPLLRAALIRDGGAEQLLLVVCHHIVGDGWSSHLLERELRASVAALADGGVPDLPAPAVRYTDAVAWQRAELTADVLADQLAYWRKTLADAPELELPGMRPRPAVRGIEGDAVVVDLPAASADALLALGRRAGTTPYVVLLTLWAVALARTSGAWDLTVGTPHAGRTRPELHDVVGLFLNTVVLRTQLAPDATFAEAVAAVDGVCREAFARHAAPFEAVADAVLPARDASRTPLFQNLFALVGDGMIGQVPRERDLGLLGRAWKVARTDLALTLWPRPDGGYGGALEFSTELYGTAVAADLAARLRDLAARFAADPRLPIGSATLPTTAAEAAESAAGPAAEGPDVEVDDARLETVLGLVRELLEQPGLGPGDDFMAAGGTSLLAARLLWGVQNAFGVEVSMRAFFDRPTAADLAAAVGDLLPAGPPGTGGEEDGREPVAALVDSPVAPGGPTERDA